METGKELRNIRKALGLATTVATIKQSKEKIKACSKRITSLGATKLSSCRSYLVEPWNAC